MPLFAIGVIVGFTRSQTGMVLHWLRDRPAGWQGKLAVNALGALLTGVAAVIVTLTKFGEGGWLIVVTLPLLLLGMDRVEAVHVTTAGDDANREEFLRQWRPWDPPVSLRMLDDPHRRLAEPLVTYLASVQEQEVFVVIAEVEPEHPWQRLLQNQRGGPRPSAAAA